jgi:hypothetical protein
MKPRGNETCPCAWHNYIMVENAEESEGKKCLLAVEVPFYLLHLQSPHREHMIKNNEYHSKHAFGNFSMNSC